MARWLVAIGAAAVLMGMAMAIPVGVAQVEIRSPNRFAFGLLLAATLLGAGGVAAVAAGFRQSRGPSMPGAVRAAVVANLFLLGFCALELSDRLIRQEGRVSYWTTYLLPLALVTFFGLVSAQRWAWWLCRVVSALATLWFLAPPWVPLIPFAAVRGEAGSVPWYGGVLIICGCVAFAGAAATAFWSLGHSTARSYFGFLKRQKS